MSVVGGSFLKDWFLIATLSAKGHQISRMISVFGKTIICKKRYPKVDIKFAGYRGISKVLLRKIFSTTIRNYINHNHYC